MSALRVVVLLVAAACVDADAITPRDGALGGKWDVFHDDARGVTCWAWKQGHGGGLSCIPDNQLRPS